MSENTAVIEAPKPEVKVQLNPVAQEFANAVKAKMEAKQAEPAKEVAKAEEPKKEEPAIEKPKSLLDGFDGKKKDAPVVEPTQEAPKDDKETNIVNLRKAKEAIEAEREQLKARIKELESNPSIPPDYEQLKADHDLLASEMKKYRLESTPEFKRKYDERLNRNTSEIQKVIATNTDLNPTEFLDLVKAPESRERLKKIDEYLEGVPDLVKNRVMSSVTEFDRIRDERASELSNPDEQLIKITQQQKEENAKIQKEELEIIHGVIQEATNAPGMEWLKENPDASPEWNAEISRIKSAAVDLWQKPMPVKSRAQAALAAAMTPLLYNLLQASRKESTEEIGRLNEELAKYRKNTPTTGASKSGGEPAPTGAAKVKSDKTAFIDSFMKASRGE